MILDSGMEIGTVDGINFPGYCGTTDTDSYVGYKNSVIKTLVSTRLASPVRSHVPSTYYSEVQSMPKHTMDVKDFVVGTLAIKRGDGLDTESYCNICLSACLAPNELVSLRIIGFGDETRWVVVEGVSAIKRTGSGQRATVLWESPTGCSGGRWGLDAQGIWN
ncbi:hypothetical protein DFH08DRAFT_812478 [Mycena albidolilacea]|uniref:Uncharacterized protein n=1 Tax=Mycena albidolilacea TaxID=1033008 RepID=A0AAD6ZTJ3_9AGAR|nr:hypothetical protein DFH08DRAFT_812478 [Mycena albidolilacea]